MAEFFCDNPKCQFHFTIPSSLTSSEADSCFSVGLSGNPFYPKAKEITKYPNNGSFGVDVPYHATIEDAIIGIGLHKLVNGVSDIESHHSAIEVDGMTITGRFCSCCMQMFDFMGVAQVEKADGAGPPPPDNGAVHHGMTEALITKLDQLHEVPSLGDLPVYYKGIAITPNIAAEAMELLFKAKYAPTKMEQEQAALVTKTPVEGFDGEQLSDPFKSLAKPTILTVDEIFEKKIKQKYPDAVMIDGKWWTGPNWIKGNDKIKSGELKALMTDATHEFALQDFDGKKGSNSYDEWIKQNNGQMAPGGGVVGVQPLSLSTLGELMQAHMLGEEAGLEELKAKANLSMIDKIKAKLKPASGLVGEKVAMKDLQVNSHSLADTIHTHPEFGVQKVEPSHEFDFINQKHYFILPSGLDMTVTAEGLDAVWAKLSSHFPNVTFNGKKLSVEDKEWLKNALYQHKVNTVPGNH